MPHVWLPFRVVLIAMLSLVASVSAMAQAPEVPGQSAEVSEATVEEAFLIHAESYAEDRGVSVEGAMRRLELQDEAGQLRAQLMTNERDVMSEVRIEHEPDFRVIVFVVPGGEAQVHPYFAEGPLSEITVVELVPYTKDQLQADLDTMMMLISPMAIPYAASISERNAEIYVLDAGALQASLADAGVIIPESVVIAEVSELPEDEGTAIGGFGLSPSCTSGFAGWYSSSVIVKGIFTAGHCQGTGGSNVEFTHLPGDTFTWYNDFDSGNADFQLNRHNTLHDLRSMINIGTTWIPITGLYWRVSMTPGAYVCKYGKTTHRTCGYIWSQDYYPGGNHNATFIWVKNKPPNQVENPSGSEYTGTNLSEPGDSGAPWHGALTATQSSAFGIHTGGPGLDSYFMAQDYLYSRGYRIFTNCPTQNGKKYMC